MVQHILFMRIVVLLSLHMVIVPAPLQRDHIALQAVLRVVMSIVTQVTVRVVFRSVRPIYRLS